MAKRNTSRPRRSPTSFGGDLLASLGEVLAAVESGGKVRLTAQTYSIPEPARYDAGGVKRTRAAVGASQALFAQLVGVSKKLVEHWEAGVRVPSQMACRLLDTINRDPAAFLRAVQQTAA